MRFLVDCLRTGVSSIFIQYQGFLEIIVLEERFRNVSESVIKKEEAFLSCFMTGNTASPGYSFACCSASSACTDR